MTKKGIVLVIYAFFSLGIGYPLTALGEQACEVVLPSSVRGTSMGDHTLLRSAASFFELITKMDDVAFKYSDLRTVNPEIGPPIHEKLPIYTQEYRSTKDITSRIWREHFKAYTAGDIDSIPHLCEVSAPFLFFVQSTMPSPFWKKGEEVQFSLRVGMTFFYDTLRIAEVYDVIFHIQDGKGKGNMVEGIMLRDGRILK